MSKSSFKQQAAQKRAAVPQIDMESTKPTNIAPVKAAMPELPKAQPAPVEPVQQEVAAPVVQSEPANQSARLTPVDTTETPTNRGFSMYPSRHRQVAKDLAYLEDRNPWEIIEDALEEYVVRHYGKEHKRK
jgi:hypothetical protein